MNVCPQKLYYSVQKPFMLYLIVAFVSVKNIIYMLMLIYQLFRVLLRLEECVRWITTVERK